MQLWVGLGNPGATYAMHRHNIGFMAIDTLAEIHDLPLPAKKFLGWVQELRLGSEKIILLKPATFMNESGRSVRAAMDFYKLEPKDVTVFYDELDLAPFKVKVKFGGGAAGLDRVATLVDAAVHDEVLATRGRHDLHQKRHVQRLPHAREHTIRFHSDHLPFNQSILLSLGKKGQGVTPARERVTPAGRVVTCVTPLRGVRLTRTHTHARTHAMCARMRGEVA